jgi:hypothetical protein
LQWTIRESLVQTTEEEEEGDDGVVVDVIPSAEVSTKEGRVETEVEYVEDLDVESSPAADTAPEQSS